MSKLKEFKSLPKSDEPEVSELSDTKESGKYRIINKSDHSVEVTIEKDTYVLPPFGTLRNKPKPKDPAKELVITKEEDNK